MPTKASHERFATVALLLLLLLLLVVLERQSFRGLLYFSG